MAVDRLDAIVIGAGVEGLAAAAALARGGANVCVVERKLNPQSLGIGKPALIAQATSRALDLTSHGLRFAPPPPVVGIAGDEHLTLWPDERAARQSIAQLSPRDADAYVEFQARIARTARTRNADQERSLSPVAWLTNPASGEDGVSPFWLSSIEHVLDEVFDTKLLKGLFAQGAVIGTGVSPLAPMSASLFARASILSAIAPDLSGMPVAGGRARLTAALLSLLKAQGTELRFGADVQEIIVDREAAQGVQLVGGTVLRAPLIVSSLDPRRCYLMLVGLRRLPPPVVRQMMGSRSEIEPALVRFVLGAPPPFKGLDAATLAASPIVRVDPGIERLAHAHAAFRRRALSDEASLELFVRPLTEEPHNDHGVRWEVVAAIPYIPPDTTEGPWSGSRRERIRDVSVARLEETAPGFSALVEEYEILNPAEAQTNMGPNGSAFLQANASSDLTALPRPPAGATPSVLKNLVVLERNIFATDGAAGLAAGLAARTGRGRLRA